MTTALRSARLKWIRRKACCDCLVARLQPTTQLSSSAADLVVPWSSTYLQYNFNPAHSTSHNEGLPYTASGRVFR